MFFLLLFRSLLSSLFTHRFSALPFILEYMDMSGTISRFVISKLHTANWFGYAILTFSSCSVNIIRIFSYYWNCIHSHSHLNIWTFKHPFINIHLSTKLSQLYICTVVNAYKYSITGAILCFVRNGNIQKIWCTRYANAWAMITNL